MPITFGTKSTAIDDRITMTMDEVVLDGGEIDKSFVGDDLITMGGMFKCLATKHADRKCMLLSGSRSFTYKQTYHYSLRLA